MKLSYETVGLNMHQEQVSLLMTGVRYIANSVGVFRSIKNKKVQDRENPNQSWSAYWEKACAS